MFRFIFMFIFFYYKTNFVAKLRVNFSIQKKKASQNCFNIGYSKPMPDVKLNMLKFI